MTIAVPAATHPQLSVVMPTYGRWELVEAALRAVTAHTGVPYEVVIVDNASPDETRARVSDSVTGAHVILNAENRGFGAAANQGAEAATAPVVCFLNSDTEVDPGWAQPLLARFETDRECAAVTPCKLNPDRSLQEAGSILTGDGEILLYGWQADPGRGEFRFARRIDYGGAACLAVRRQAFLDAGGFDPAYGIGYYEDVDLCFTLAERGGHTIYEPASRIRHVGGASSSDTEVAALLSRNRQLFLSRWSARLRGRTEAARAAGREVIRLRDWDATPRLLVLDDGRRTRQVAVAAAAALPAARVTLLTASGPEIMDPLGSRGVEVLPCSEPATLAQRTDHYSVVVVADSASAEEWSALVATQPTASVVLVETDAGPGDSMFPHAALMLAMDARAAVRIAGAPAVAVGRTVDADRLVATLSGLGITSAPSAAPERPGG